MMPSTPTFAKPGECPTCGDDLVLLLQFYACKHADCATRPRKKRCPQCGTAEVEVFNESGYGYGRFGYSPPRRWHCLPKGHCWTP